MTLSATEWTIKLAHALGAPTPSDDEVEALLALAGVSAHASERPAAPIACWLAAKAGVAPGDALVIARRLEGSP